VRPSLGPGLNRTEPWPKAQPMPKPKPKPQENAYDGGQGNRAKDD